MNDRGDRNVTAHETLDERLLNRMLFFTDAVFAIVLTLMVLDLKPPAFDTPFGDRAATQGMLGHFFALTMSFVVIGIFWVAHLSTTRRLARFDWPTTVANLAFMFPVCLLPFSTAWWGRSLGAPFPWGMYCAVMIVCSLANVALVLVSTRGAGRLMSGGVTPRERAYRTARAATPGLAFALGILVMTTGQVQLAQFCWVLIPILLIVFGRTLKPRRQPAA